MTTDDSKDPQATPFGIPGAGNLHEVMDSMQKAWGFNAATPMAPTLDIDEIDRRLQDLNTISQWLSLNQNMLQSTIQTLQVQRATLAAIQSFGTAAESKGDADAVSPMDVMQAFTKMFAPPQGAPEAAASASGAAAGKPSTGAAGAKATSATGAGAKPGSGPAAADPHQWWAMLQNQFAQVTSAALSAQKAAAQAASPKPAARKKTAQPKSSRKPTKSKSS